MAGRGGESAAIRHAHAATRAPLQNRYERAVPGFVTTRIRAEHFGGSLRAGGGPGRVTERDPISEPRFDLPNTACLRGQACGTSARTEWSVWGVVELSCWGRSPCSWRRWLRGGPGSATT